MRKLKAVAKGWRILLHNCAACKSKREVLVEFEGKLQHVPRHVPKGRLIGSTLEAK